MLFRHLIVIDNYTAIIIPVNTEQNEIVELWEMLLSREPEWIEKAFESLLPDQKSAVLAHLQKMVSEPGWQPEQQISAQAALDTILNNQP